VNFPPETMELRHIPSLYRADIGEIKRDKETDIEEIDLAVEIPGDCWIQLMQKVNYSALEAVGDLLASHISAEIDDFKGGKLEQLGKFNSVVKFIFFQVFICCQKENRSLLN
jgi:hypothetical protein